MGTAQEIWRAGPPVRGEVFGIWKWWPSWPWTPPLLQWWTWTTPLVQWQRPTTPLFQWWTRQLPLSNYGAPLFQWWTRQLPFPMMEPPSSNGGRGQLPSSNGRHGHLPSSNQYTCCSQCCSLHLYSTQCYSHKSQVPQVTWFALWAELTRLKPHWVGLERND